MQFHSELRPAGRGFFISGPVREVDHEETARPPAQERTRQVRAQEEMLKPLHDRILVELDESIPNQAGLIIPIKVDRWTGKDGAIESYGRGKVAACGPGKRHPKTQQPQRMVFQSPEGVRPVQEGDVIRFSELEYTEHKEDGRRYALITEGDIVGVECADA